MSKEKDDWKLVVIELLVFASDTSMSHSTFVSYLQQVLACDSIEEARNYVGVIKTISA